LSTTNYDVKISRIHFSSFSTASIFNLVLLSLDRYWAVVYPLRYLQNRSRKQATNFIGIVWFISLLWAPAIIFWSHIIPKYSDIIKATECDTSFRSNKLFKTLTALVNFYLPLLTMIIISCRIMVAVRLRSKMEFGRRLSSTTQKQMRQERAFANASFKRQENQTSEKKFSTYLSSDETDKQSISIAVNPFDSVIKHSNISLCQIDDTESLEQLESERSPSIDETHFCFPPIKPITIIFPSLSSIREQNGRKNDVLSRKDFHKKSMKNSLSFSNNMTYSPRQSNITSASLNYIPRTLSKASLTDECPQTIFVYPIEEQLSTPTEKLPVYVFYKYSTPHLSV